MATSLRKLDIGVLVAVVLVLAVVKAGARPVIEQDFWCTTRDEYVYPQGALCQEPAFLYLESYHLVSVHWTTLGGLEPEWDESNSTYYVRFSGDNIGNLGAQYVATTMSSVALPGQGPGPVELPLRVNSPVYLYNVETLRYLKWRQEGTDEYFLIEEEASSGSEAAAFRFVQAKDVGLPCILPLPPVECQAYYLISDPGSSMTDAGLLASVEEGITYVKAAPSSSVGDLPLLIFRTRSLTTTTVASTAA